MPLFSVSLDLSCDQGSLLTGLCNRIDRNDPTHVVGPLLEHLLSGLLVIVAVIIGGRLLRSFLDRGLHRAHADPQVRTLVHNVVSAVTWIVALVGGLVAVGLNLSVLLTFGGVSTLAIGLAFQDLLRNVLAGIFILIEQPFRIGDTITVANQVGTVETINLRTTALRTGDGRLAILPNLSAFNEVVVNSSAYRQRQYTVNVYVDADADLGKVMSALRREVEATAALVADPPPMLQPQVDGEGRRMVAVKYWLDQHDQSPDDVAADLTSRIWSATSPPQPAQA